jgi:hypothetical protein
LIGLCLADEIMEGIYIMANVERRFKSEVQQGSIDGMAE